MNRNDNSPLNLFKYSDRSKFVVTKRRDYSNNNPFFYDNGTQEISFNGTIKLKTTSRLSHAINPFENYSKKTREKSPFFKGDRNTYCAFKGLNNNDNKSNIANSSKRYQPLIIKPNFNIYICDNNFFEDIPSGNENINPFATNGMDKKMDSFNKINNTTCEEKREDKDINLTESLCAPAPAIDPMIDLINRVERLKLDDGKTKKQRRNELRKQNKKNKEEKIYTNDGNCTIGEDYF
jgi:hypothetical protein